MKRNSTTGNSNWTENICKWLNQMEDRNRVFDILKNFPNFIDNRAQINEIYQLIKLLSIDDCCVSTDSRSVRFFFLREEL